MGIEKLGLKLIKEAANITKTRGKSILSKNTEEKMCNYILDFKKYGLSQGERKALEQKSGKKAADVFEYFIENLSEGDIKTVIKAVGKKSYQERYLTTMREKITDTCRKETLMKDSPKKPFSKINEVVNDNHGLKEIKNTEISIPHQKNSGLDICKPDFEPKTMDTVKDSKKTSCKMFTEKKGSIDEEQPFLMLLGSCRGNKELPAQIITESKIPGQYEIFDIMPNGKRFKTGLAEIGKKGEKHVERHLVSTDGKTTDLVYRDDNKGNTFLYSVIKDKNGKVMSETRRKFKKISRNHFMSSYNGQSYDIKWSNDKVVVTKLDNAGKKTKETVEFAIMEKSPKIFAGHSTSSLIHLGLIPEQTIDSELVDMLKRVPGDEWFTLKKTCPNIFKTCQYKYNASYENRLIEISDEHKSNFGIFSHEAGHSKFEWLNLEKDKKLLSIYNKERKKYQAMFPENMQKSIDYFLEDGGCLRGLSETAAETNLVNNTIQSFDGTQSRTIFLEKYFPETLAYIKNKFATI